jgi:hypothetical protein
MSPVITEVNDYKYGSWDELIAVRFEIAEVKLCRKYKDIGQVLNFQALPILTEVLTGNLVLLLCVGCKIDQSISFEYLCQLQFQGHWGPFLFLMEISQFVPGMPKDQQNADKESS